MAGDEDRPQPEPAAGVQPVSEADREGVAAREPSMAAGAADLAAPDRPAESFGETAAPLAPASAAAPPRSMMSTLLALIGAVLILLLAANLYTLYNPPGSDAVPALQSEAAALKQRVAALEGRPPVDLAPIDTRVAALAGALAPLDTRVSALAGDLAPLKAAVGRNTEAGQAGAEAKAAMVPLVAQVSDLGSRLAGLQDAVTALPKVDLAPVETKVAGLETRLGGVDTGMSDLGTKIVGLDQRLPPLEAYFTAPKAPVQATAIRQNGSAAETRAAPLAVIAQGILATIPSGRPFATDTKALAQLGVAPATLAPLETVATTGAVTDQELVQGFEAVQDGIVVAAAPVSTGTMFDRIMANAQGVVKVSRTGAAAGEGSDAIASRIAADLKAGALLGAATEWDTLPEASRTRSAAWASRLKARIAAETAARSIGAGAVAALAAAP